MRLSKRGTVNWTSVPRRKLPRLTYAPMTKEEFRWLCEQLAIPDNVTAGELFGLNWRTCQRYWYGELTIPQPMARLLRLAAQYQTTHDDLRRLASCDTRLRYKS